jgi:L-cysteine desulfidase
VDDAQSSLMLLIAQNNTCMLRVTRGMYHQKVTEHKATSTSRSAKTRLIPAKLVLEHRLLVSLTSKTSNVGHAYLVHCFVIHIARHEGSLRQLVLVCVPAWSGDREVV